MISETEAYFEAKDKSFYEKGIELFEKYWNQFITLEGDLINKVEFCLKVITLLVKVWDLLSDVFKCIANDFAI